MLPWYCHQPGTFQSSAPEPQESDVYEIMVLLVCIAGLQNGSFGGLLDFSNFAGLLESIGYSECLLPVQHNWSLLNKFDFKSSGIEALSITPP
jgi:hypothetical protein